MFKVYVVFCFLVFDCQYQCSWLPEKTRLRNDLLCVEWDVTPCTLTHSHCLQVRCDFVISCKAILVGFCSNLCIFTWSHIPQLKLLSFLLLLSSRQLLSNDCLEDKREDYQNCSAMFILCNTVVFSYKHTYLSSFYSWTVARWFRLWLLYMCVYFVINS